MAAGVGGCSLQCGVVGRALGRRAVGQLNFFEVVGFEYYFPHTEIYVASVTTYRQKYGVLPSTCVWAGHLTRE